MITFNELYITKDNKYLIIDVYVQNLDYYDDIEIDSIMIDNKDTYVKNGPSSTPVYTHTVPEEGLKNLETIIEEATGNKYIEDDSKYWILEDKVKRVYLKIKASDIKDFNGILFVYVTARGVPSASTPCTMDNMVTMQSVTNLYPFYKNLMGYVKNIGDTCDIPKDFIDLILRLDALRLSIRTCNYDKAIEYYNKFFSDVKPVNIKSCGCSR